MAIAYTNANPHSTAMMLATSLVVPSLLRFIELNCNFGYSTISNQELGFLIAVL